MIKSKYKEEYLKEEYLRALGNFWNDSVNYWESSIVAEMLRKNIEYYVNYLQSQLEVSEQKRLKAIKYIKELETNEYGSLYYDIGDTSQEELLEILGGKDE